MSRRKLTERFIETLHDDFVVHGPEIIERLRIESPSVYAQVCAKLVPPEIEISEKDGLEDLLSGMSHRERIAWFKEQIAAWEAEDQAQEAYDQLSVNQRIQLSYRRDQQAPKTGGQP
jgi:hypothetical protein